MKVAFYVLMFVLGAALGSFLCCQAWRLRLAQKKKRLGKRSVCLHCKKQLKWYDNIPIVSWLVLRGKCRYCKKSIGASEIIAEILTGVVFLVLAHLFVTEYGGDALLGGNVALVYACFATLVLLSLVLIFLAIYDGKWGELPTIFLIIACVLTGAYWLLNGFCIGFSMEYVWHSRGALAILAGLYEVLYLVSKGRWVGDGDAILCVALALGLGNAWLAVFVLFLANALGCICALPGVVRGKKPARIYFGPFLVAAFFIVLLLSEQILGLVVF